MSRNQSTQLFPPSISVYQKWSPLGNWPTHKIDAKHTRHLPRCGTGPKASGGTCHESFVKWKWRKWKPGLRTKDLRLIGRAAPADRSEVDGRTLNWWWALGCDELWLEWSPRVLRLIRLAHTYSVIWLARTAVWHLIALTRRANPFLIKCHKFAHLI